MPTLRIDLQEGFGGDEVALEVDGREVFREEGVRTDRRLGLAVARPGRSTYYESEVAGGGHTIKVSLPRRNLSKVIEVSAEAGTYLGVSVEGGEITCVVSKTPMGYA
ncbi:MAG TPA: hypothetical protein VF586_09900 [Pyrinomonadaceae bacterium]